MFGSLTPDGFDPERDRIDADGSWKLEDPNDDPDGPTSSVLLKFGRVAGADADRTGTADALGRDGKMERLGFMHYNGCHPFTRAE